MDTGNRREKLKDAIGTSLRVLLGLSVMVGSIGLGVWLKLPPPRPNVPTYIKLFGGNAERLAPLRAPTHVEAFRLVRLNSDPKSSSGLRDYNAEPCHFVVPQKIHEQLAAALTSPTLSRIAWRACDADYDVKLSLYHEDDKLDVLLNFDCNTLLVISGNEVLGTANLTKIRTPIVRVVQELFPSDKKFRALKVDGT